MKPSTRDLPCRQTVSTMKSESDKLIRDFIKGSNPILLRNSLSHIGEVPQIDLPPAAARMSSGILVMIRFFKISLATLSLSKAESDDVGYYDQTERRLASKYYTRDNPLFTVDSVGTS